MTRTVSNGLHKHHEWTTPLGARTVWSGFRARFGLEVDSRRSVREYRKEDDGQSAAGEVIGEGAAEEAASDHGGIEALGRHGEQ